MIRVVTEVRLRNTDRRLGFSTGKNPEVIGSNLPHFTKKETELQR